MVSTKNRRRHALFKRVLCLLFARVNILVIEIV